MTHEHKIANRDNSDPPTLRKPPTLLDAARALLEARENQMVTRVEWDDLAQAVAAAQT